MTTGAVARLLRLDPSTVRRAADRGELRAVRSAKGDRVFDPCDIAAYRRVRLARLAGALRVAAEPRGAEPFDAAQSAALDVALDVEQRLEESDGPR